MNLFLTDDLFSGFSLILHSEFDRRGTPGQVRACAMQVEGGNEEGDARNPAPITTIHMDRGTAGQLISYQTFTKRERERESVCVCVYVCVCELQAQARWWWADWHTWGRQDQAT